MITHPTLDQRYLTIDEFNNRKIGNENIRDEEITPLELADEMEKNGRAIVQLCKEMELLTPLDPVNFKIELNDVKTWAYLSLYFAAKLRGGVSLDKAVKTKACKIQRCCGEIPPGSSQPLGKYH